MWPHFWRNSTINHCHLHRIKRYLLFHVHARDLVPHLHRLYETQFAWELTDERLWKGRILCFPHRMILNIGLVINIYLNNCKPADGPLRCSVSILSSVCLEGIPGTTISMIFFRSYVSWFHQEKLGGIFLYPCYDHYTVGSH